MDREGEAGEGKSMMEKRTYQVRRRVGCGPQTTTARPRRVPPVGVPHVDAAARPRAPPHARTRCLPLGLLGEGVPGRTPASAPQPPVRPRHGLPASAGEFQPSLQALDGIAPSRTAPRLCRAGRIPESCNTVAALSKLLPPCWIKLDTPPRSPDGSRE
jgi:hypothetical protein